MMDDANSCMQRCWMIAGGVGLVVLILLMLVAGWGFVLSLLVGLALTLLIGLMLPRAMCPEEDAGARRTATPTPGGEAPTEGAASYQPQPTAVMEPAGGGATSEPEPEAETRSEDTGPKPAAAPARESAPSADGEAEGGVRPELLDAPRGTPDDLKKIKGVGPKLEEKLYTMGVYHYWQIASWSPAEVDWIDDQLNFRGRITRDDWVGQAVTLAEGGETEFSARSKE